jgi:hypothetical protein
MLDRFRLGRASFSPSCWSRVSERPAALVKSNQRLSAIQTRRSSTLLFICGSLRMLRIEKLLGITSTVLRLSGRIQEEYLSQLQTEIEQCTDTPRLDLKDVSLLDRVSVRFLMRCESQGIQLVNCPLYIQEWISRERRRAVPRADNE